MAEPTLSEIVNIPVDQERATGTPAVVFDSKPLIAQLNQAAQYKAENDWRKYNVFLGNLKEVYKDINEIAKMPVMTQDQPYLKEQMANILKEVSEDPKGFFSGGAKYQDVLGKISKLQSDATESKQNSAYDFAHRQYFYRNPSLDTKQNRELIDSYGNQKLGSRQPYLMKLPALWDPKAMADAINASIEEKLTQDMPTKDGKYINRQAETNYDPNEFMSRAGALYGNVAEAVNERFNQMPDSVKSKYTGPDPARQWYNDVMSAYLNKGDKSSTLTGDPNYLEAERLAEQRRHNKATEAIQWANVNKGDAEGEKTKAQIGELYNRFFSTAFSDNSNAGIAYLQNVYGDNNEIKKVVEKGDPKKEGSTRVEVPVPKKEVISSEYDPVKGVVKIKIRDNSVPSKGWGKYDNIEEKIITEKDALVDFGRMFGPKISPEQVTSIATEYRKKKGWGDLKPDLKTMQTAFGIIGGQPAPDGPEPVTDPELLKELNKK